MWSVVSLWPCCYLFQFLGNTCQTVQGNLFKFILYFIKFDLNFNKKIHCQNHQCPNEDGSMTMNK
jgi:hypothetical protein